MDKQETLITKKRGPKPTGVGTLIGVRILPDLLTALDEWIAGQEEPKPTRPEAVRRILRAALRKD